MDSSGSLLEVWISGSGLEVTAFAGLCSIAANHLDRQSEHFWPTFLATIPYSYLCAYSISRAAMAYVRKSALKGAFFEIHKAIGVCCVLYSIPAWYKLVILKGDPIKEDSDWKTFDNCLRLLAALSTLFNEISGILLFPHVSLEAPLILRQIFTIGTSMGLATYMLMVLIQLRAWFPHGNLLVSLASTITVLWNVVAVSFGVRAAVILGREKVLTDAELNVVEAERKKLKLKRPVNVLSFFYDNFLEPAPYDGTMSSRAGLQLLAYRSKRVAQAVTLSTSSIPGIFMGLIAFNLAFRADMAVLGAGDRRNATGIHYTITVIEMMALCVIPGNMLDLTLVLRKRMRPIRAAVEIPASFLSSMLATLPLCFALFPNTEAWEWVAMVRAMVWPLTGSNF